jgi:hypothetical protein
MPTHDAHPDAGQRVRFEITHPPIDYLVVRVESFDRARVYTSLKILLRLFVRERAPWYRPQRASRRERDHPGDGDTERGGGVWGKVCRQLDQLYKMRTELEGRDGDAVRARMSVRVEKATAVHNGRVPLTLFWVYVYATQRLDRRYDWALGVGWWPEGGGGHMSINGISY